MAHRNTQKPPRYGLKPRHDVKFWEQTCASHVAHSGNSLVPLQRDNRLCFHRTSYSKSKSSKLFLRTIHSPSLGLKSRRTKNVAHCSGNKRQKGSRKGLDNSPWPPWNFLHQISRYSRLNARSCWSQQTSLPTWQTFPKRTCGFDKLACYQPSPKYLSYAVLEGYMDPGLNGNVWRNLDAWCWLHRAHVA